MLNQAILIGCYHQGLPTQHSTVTKSYWYFATMRSAVWHPTGWTVTAASTKSQQSIVTPRWMSAKRIVLFVILYARHSYPRGPNVYRCKQWWKLSLLVDQETISFDLHNNVNGCSCSWIIYLDWSCFMFLTHRRAFFVLKETFSFGSIVHLHVFCFYEGKNLRWSV